VQRKDPRSSPSQTRARRAAIRRLKIAFDMLRFFATDSELEEAERVVFVLADAARARHRGEVAS